MTTPSAVEDEKGVSKNKDCFLLSCKHTQPFPSLAAPCSILQGFSSPEVELINSKFLNSP